MSHTEKKRKRKPVLSLLIFFCTFSNKTSSGVMLIYAAVNTRNGSISSAADTKEWIMCMCVKHAVILWIRHPDVCFSSSFLCKSACLSGDLTLSTVWLHRASGVLKERPPLKRGLCSPWKYFCSFVVFFFFSSAQISCRLAGRVSTAHYVLLCFCSPSSSLLIQYA